MAPAEPLPDRLPPMLVRPGLPPAGALDQWALELKWDGMRAQFRVARDDALSRAPPAVARARACDRVRASGRLGS
jgi:ATP-dependent DNA ligase